jgi:hypothetical protein
MHISYKNSSVLLQNLHSHHCLVATRMPGHCRPRTRPAQIRSARGGSPRNAQMRSARSRIRSNRCKKIKPRVETNMVATRTGSAMLRRCSRVVASGQRRPVNLAVLMMVASDPVYIKEGGADGIDAATPTSKPVAPLSPP